MADNADTDEDTIRILVATDTHVGYGEKDKVRGDDALNTFEEILHIGRTKGADFFLHGGDLFHDNKPSRGCLYRTMDALRRHCLGPGAVSVEIMNNLDDRAHFSRGQINFEDVNVNVEMPFFMIHGNHDDPGGDSNLSAANLLEAASLVNYFGRAENLEDIVVKPILLKKGRTQLAIYGLGNIRDERLHRAFLAKNVNFHRPPETGQGEWYHVAIIHQNRHKGNRGGVPSKSCIHEDMLPRWLNLVIWGHEHDCEVMPQESLAGEFYVVQPGSSVATALTPGEQQRKHVAMIDIRLGEFRCLPQPLWSVRPLMMKEVSLADSGLLRTDTQAIWQYLAGEVEGLIAAGQAEVAKRRAELQKSQGDPNGGASSSSRLVRRLETPALPLVRVRVEHMGFDTISGQSFGQQFADRLANPDEILIWHKKGVAAADKGKRTPGAVMDNLEIEEAPPSEEGLKIQDIIYKYIEGDQSLQILSEPDLNDAVQSFVHRQEQCAIEKFVKLAVEATNQAVMRESRAIREEEIRVQIQDRAESLRQQRLGHAGALPSAPQQAAHAQPPAISGLGSGVGGGVAGAAGSGADLMLGRVEIPESQAKNEQLGDPQRVSGTLGVVEPTQSLGGRGRGRGRGGRGGRGGSKRSQEDLDADDPMAPAKVIRNQRARASGANATGAALSAPPTQNLREMLLGPPAQPPVPSESLAAPVDTAAPQHRLEQVEATPFLRKRGAVLGDTAFGGPTGAADTAADAANSLRGLSQTTTRRQWALR